MKRIWIFLPLLMLALLPCSALAAPVNLALHQPVTGSAYYSSGSEVFPFHNVTDGFLGDINDGEASPNHWSFWLTPNSQNGYVTIDLQALCTVEYFKVQDTHNRGYYDRGTADFRILLSTDNLNFSPVVDDSFTLAERNNLTINTYNITPATARYVQFIADSRYGSSAGINELEVWGQPYVVPLPGAVWLLGSGLLGLLGLGRKLKK